MNKQIRKFFPKGTSVDGYTFHQIKEINRSIVESQILSLDGYSPKEAFIKLFGLETYEKYFGK